MLDETSTNTRLLLDATEGLKDDTRKVHGEIESVHSACRALDTKLDHKLNSGPPSTVDSLPGSIPDSGTYVDRSPPSYPSCQEVWGLEMRQLRVRSQWKKYRGWS